jgi:hypothetical protein
VQKLTKEPADQRAFCVGGPEMLGSILGIVEDVAKIAIAPVKIAADMTRTVTKPMADAAVDAADSVEEATKGARGD